MKRKKKSAIPAMKWEPVKFAAVVRASEQRRPAIKALALARLILILEPKPYEIDFADALEKVTSEFPLTASDAAAVRAAYVLICQQA